MRIWSASATCRYYLDPAIELLGAMHRAKGRQLAAGYYIVPHWGSERRQAFGEGSMRDLGPFTSRAKARNWSRKYLVEPEATQRAEQFRKHLGMA
jgi:hypothetical protein